MKARMWQWTLPAVVTLVLVGCMSTDTGERRIDRKAAAVENTKLGTELMRRGSLRDAKEKLDKALKFEPDNAEANWVMGLLLEQLDRPAESDRFYKTARRAQPDNPDIANTYAVYLCKSGKIDEALPLFEGLIRNKLYREPWAAATNAAVCLRADKRNADALAFLDRALTMRADYVEAVIQKADVQLALGRGPQSRQTVDAYLALAKVKEADPHRPDVLMIGVRAALAAGDREAANTYARLLRRDFPKAPQTEALPTLFQGAK